MVYHSHRNGRQFNRRRFSVQLKGVWWTLQPSNHTCLFSLRKVSFVQTIACCCTSTCSSCRMAAFYEYLYAAHTQQRKYFGTGVLLLQKVLGGIIWWSAVAAAVMQRLKAGKRLQPLVLVYFWPLPLQALALPVIVNPAIGCWCRSFRYELLHRPIGAILGIARIRSFINPFFVSSGRLQRQRLKQLWRP